MHLISNKNITYHAHFVNMYDKLLRN